MTIDVIDDYAIVAGRSVHGTDEDVVYIGPRSDGTTASFWNYGSIHLDASTYQYAAIDIGDGQGGEVTNAAGGLIEARSSADATIVYGIMGDMYGCHVVNDGRIKVIGGNSADGVRIYGGDPTNSILNHGEIKVTADQYASGAGLYYGGTLENDGLIKVTSVHGSAGGASAGGYSDSHFVNTGRIIVHSGAAPDSVGVSIFGLTDASTFSNTGLIKADVAIRGDNIGHMLWDDGTLVGDVWLSGDFGERGLHHGDVIFGGGDSTYDGAAGLLQGGVYGGGGADRLVCGDGDQVLFGDGIAQSGAAGDDTLVGGSGADTLTGGGGADRLVYNSLADSLVAAPDVIRGLKHVDRIDLSGIDADAGLAGDQAFQRVAALDGHSAELAVTYDAAANVSHIDLDVDGDGVADARINAQGDHTDFGGFVL